MTEPGILILKLLSITYLAQTRHGALRKRFRCTFSERSVGTTLKTASKVVVLGGHPTNTVGSVNASLGAASFSAGCGLQNTRRGTEHRVAGRLSKKRSVLEDGWRFQTRQCPRIQFSPRTTPVRIRKPSLILRSTLIDGPSGAIVEGMVYNVEHEKHAEMLGEIRNASLPRVTMFDPLYR